MHNEARAGVAQPGQEIAGARLRVQRRGDTAGKPDAVQRDRGFDPVGQHKRDAIAGPHACVVQMVCEAGGLLPERGVVDVAFAIDECDPLRRSASDAGDAGGETLHGLGRADGQPASLRETNASTVWMESKLAGVISSAAICSLNSSSRKNTSSWIPVESMMPPWISES